MVNTHITISVEDAQDIHDDCHDGLELVSIQEMSEHRWYTKQLVVFRDSEDAQQDLLGFYYLDPATEMQEDSERFESDPVSVFYVIGNEVIRTVYDVV